MHAAEQAVADESAQNPNSPGREEEASRRTTGFDTLCGGEEESERAGA